LYLARLLVVEPALLLFFSILRKSCAMVLPGEGQNALQHVIETVLQLDSGHPLVRALSHCGYGDICSVIAMTTAHIDELTYKDDLGRETRLSMPYGFPIKILQRYYEYCTAQGTPVCDAWWMSIAAHHFNAFAETLAFVPTSFPWAKNESSLPLPSLPLSSFKDATLTEFLMDPLPPIPLCPLTMLPTVSVPPAPKYHPFRFGNSSL
jgi:hypothetical protein